MLSTHPAARRPSRNAVISLEPLVGFRHGAEHLGQRRLRFQLIKIETDQGVCLLKIKIDMNLCIGSGMCTGIAPQLFELDDNGKLIVLNPEPGPEHMRVLNAAIACCPVEAISCV